ncbi:MAG: PAS domain S-box protein, partial [Vibrio metschnikovii]
MLLTEENTIEPPHSLLSRHQQRLIHIFDIFSEGIFHMDRYGTMTFYNPSFYQQFGFNSATIGLENWMALVHPLDRMALEQRVDGHLNQESRV